MPLISYNTDASPTESGVYACRIPSDDMPGFYEDKFLMFFDGKWVYIGSDQKYRGTVSGWVGPLQRKMK